MINLIRMDERLIHGQIATKWSRYTEVTHIVVADDEAANNKIIQKSLMMAAPSHLKTTVRTVDSAIGLLNDERSKPLRMLVLVKNPWNMNRILEAVPGIQKVNIGNYGRVEPEHAGHPRKRYGDNLYIDDVELPEFQKIASHEGHVFYQTMPEEPVQDLKKLLES